MIRKLLMSFAVLSAFAFTGTSIAEAGGCYRGGGYYGGGGFYGPPVHRSSYYYGAPRASYYRAPPVYHSRHYYGGPRYYRGGYRPGVSLSFGF